MLFHREKVSTPGEVIITGKAKVLDCAPDLICPLVTASVVYSPYASPNPVHENCARNWNEAYCCFFYHSVIHNISNK